jgi:predicted ABC-type exoprotein transport system permease subunit
MKKRYLNILHSHISDSILVKYLFQSKVKKIFLLFLLPLFTATIYAQSSSSNIVIPQVMEVSLYLSSMRVSEQNLNSTYSNSQNLENLIYKAQPSIYFYSGVVKTYGERPSCLYTDFISLKNADNSSILKTDIEIVKLKIKDSNDLNAVIDLAFFSNYINLKYIFIDSNITINDQNVANMIRNYDGKYNIFYKIDKGE